MVYKSPPKEGSRNYKKIVELGCKVYWDYDGCAECEHDYPWNCEDCPCCIEHNRAEWEIVQKEFNSDYGAFFKSKRNK